MAVHISAYTRFICGARRVRVPRGHRTSNGNRNGPSTGSRVWSLPPSAILPSGRLRTRAGGVLYYLVLLSFYERIFSLSFFFFVFFFFFFETRSERCRVVFLDLFSRKLFDTRLINLGLSVIRLGSST